MPGTHTGPETVPAPTSRTGKHNLQGTGWRTREALAPTMLQTHLTSHKHNTQKDQSDPSHLTTSQNKAQEYLEEYKYIQHTRGRITMSGIQPKISRHTKKQENTFCNKKDNKFIRTDPKLTQVLELADGTLKQISQRAQVAICSKS